jgi:hypothetical protein
MRLLSIFVFLAVVGLAVFQEFFRHDPVKDAAGILARLWTRQAAMTLAEFSRGEGINKDRVAAALTRLDALGLIRREEESDAWAAMVRTESNEG